MVSGLLLREQLGHAVRKKGIKQIKAPTFTLAYFKRVTQGSDTERPDGVRDRALLLLGLAGAFHRDELASLDLVHLRFDDDGLVVELPKSKTNQKGSRGESHLLGPRPTQLPGAHR